jgi:hypothetical protein
MKYIWFVVLIVLGVKPLTSFSQNDSISFYNKKYGYKSYIAPTLLITYGLINLKNNGPTSSLSIKNYRDDNWKSFKTSTDDYLAFSPGLIMIGLDLLKVKSTSNIPNKFAITTKSIILGLGLVNILKYSTETLRPDESNKYSFPSGHTAFAFILAEILHQEYKNKPFVIFSGYTLATTVGAMRILNNKHWFSDVCVGAGIGIISTKLIYATHRNKWKMNKNNLFPIIGTNQLGFTYSF